MLDACVLDVGFRVGGDTGINTVVIQIHYTHKAKRKSEIKTWNINLLSELNQAFGTT